MKLQSAKGVFWVVEGSLLAFPFENGTFDSGLAKSGDTYAHNKLWRQVRPKKSNKPFNYYPRGRIENMYSQI